MRRAFNLRYLASVIQTAKKRRSSEIQRSLDEKMQSNVTIDEKDVYEKELSGQLKYERESLIVLLAIENEFRKFYEFYCEEVKKQIEPVEILRNLSMSYIARVCSTVGCPCVSPIEHPQVAVTIRNISSKYEEYCKQLHHCNKHLTLKLEKIRPHLLKFRSLTLKLNKKIETPFMLGDAYHKPISYFVELVDDIFKYMHSKLIKLDYQLQQLDPYNLESIEEYAKTIQRSEEFEEHLFMRLTYCHCLQPKPICPIVRLNTESVCSRLQNETAHIELRATLNVNRQARCFQKRQSIFNTDVRNYRSVIFLQ